MLPARLRVPRTTTTRDRPHENSGIDFPIGRQEGIDLGQRQRLGGALRKCAVEPSRERDVDDERAAALEHIEAARTDIRRVDVHGCLPHARAARLTASTIRTQLTEHGSHTQLLRSFEGKRSDNWLTGQDGSDGSRLDREFIPA
jgi:hypothetical protein